MQNIVVELRKVTLANLELQTPASIGQIVQISTWSAELRRCNCTRIFHDRSYLFPDLGKRAWRLPFRYHDSLLPVNLVISGFVSLSAVRSVGGEG